MIGNDELREGFVPAQDDVAALSPLDIKPGLLESPQALASRRGRAVCSYGHHEDLKSFLGHRQAIFFESSDVALDGLLDILSCLPSRLALADATLANLDTPPPNSRLGPDKSQPVA